MNGAAQCRFNPQGAGKVSERRGFSLLEMVLALAVFLGALAVLTQYVWSGSRASVQSQLLTQGLLRCESKLAAVVSGVEPMQPQSDTPFSDSERWLWSLTVGPGTNDGLLDVRVSVRHNGNSAWSQVNVSLQQWVRDPQYLLDAQTSATAQSSSSGSVLGL